MKNRAGSEPSGGTDLAAANTVAPAAASRRTIAARRLGDLIRALATGEGPEGMMRGRLALSAVVMAAARGRELGGRQAERHAAALAVARSLIAPETASEN
ncbi:hypothetical protein ACFW95_28445 [Streptomyces sp. NPDC059474]|uniref:hypothetical protein n=1 Tax=Streptomyces sp. NPDC059474 TaxID=3346846 RepID=UPI0036A897BF